MIVVTIHEAKTRLSQLLAQMEAGEDIIIARSGKHVARLTPIVEQANMRTLGKDRSLFEVPEDFDSSLPEELLREFSS